MGQNWVARNPLSTVVLSVCLGATQAFVAPSAYSLKHEHSCQHQQQRYCSRIAARGPVLRRSSVRVAMTQEGGEEEGGVPTSSTDVLSSGSEDAAAKAAKLRSIAAELRAQAEVLESQRDSERRQAAEQAFASFDTNDDGTVDVKELVAGLEGQLRQDFMKRMTKRMQRKPSQAEVDEKIAEMPGGVLLPVELGQKLIEIYDTNGDGVLQPDEFVPKEDIRLRLDSLFADQAQETRVKAAEARVKEIEERGAVKAREEAKARGLPLPEDFNDDPPTSTDKLLSALPYVLPLMDSLVFGAHIFNTFPTQLSFLEPLVAILLIYRSLPFSGLILFFGLQWYASKPEVNRLVRYNFRQAVNIDIAMFFPSLIGFIAAFALGDDSAKLAPIAAVGSDVIFVTVILAVLYSTVSSALGVLPDKIPLISTLNVEGRRKVNDKKDEKEDGDSDEKP